jgi:hypothetical protein
LASTQPGTPGDIGLAVFGYNLKNDLVIPGDGIGVQTIYGRVKWDGALLEPAGGAVGDFLKQGGAAASLCPPFASSQSVEGSTQGFCAQRAGTRPYAYGNGEIFVFALRPRAGVRSGTSTVQFIEGSGEYPQERVIIFPALGVIANPRHQPLDHYYGGTITIR